MEVCKYSTAPVSEVVKVREPRSPPSWEDIQHRSLITFASEEGWYLAKVVGKYDHSETLTVKALHPPGKSQLYRELNEPTKAIDHSVVLTLPRPKIQRKGAGEVTLLVREKNEAQLQYSILKGKDRLLQFTNALFKLD